MTKRLRRVAPQFAFGGRNARVVERGGGIHVEPGLQIRQLDLEQSKKLVAQQLAADASVLKVRVALAKKAPAVTEADLKSVTGRLARFSTRFNPGDRKRTNHIRLAVREVTGGLTSRLPYQSIQRVPTCSWSPDFDSIDRELLIESPDRGRLRRIRARPE